MIGGLIALIRASEPHHAAAIQNVLNDARKRILAILAEDKPVQQSQPSEPML